MSTDIHQNWHPTQYTKSEPAQRRQRRQRLKQLVFGAREIQPVHAPRSIELAFLFGAIGPF